MNLNLQYMLKKRITLISEGKNISDKLKIISWLLNLKKYSLYIKNEDGEFYVRPNSSDLWCSSTQGEDHIRKYFKIGAKGVFIDIGANIGKYSILLGNKNKQAKILAFEPEKTNLKSLEKNLLLSNVKNVKIFPIALAEKKETKKFFINKPNSGRHSLKIKTDKYITIKTNTLDNIILKEKIKRVDLIKIDVEGAEIEVLSGALKTLKKYHPKIIIEIFDEDRLKKVKKILKKFDYKIKHVNHNDFYAV